MGKHGKQHITKIANLEEWKKVKKEVVIDLYNEVREAGIGILEMSRRLNILRQSITLLKRRCLDPEADVTLGTICALKWLLHQDGILVKLNDTVTTAMTLEELVAYRKENYSFSDLQEPMGFKDATSLYAFEKSLTNGLLNFRFSNLYMYMRFLCVDAIVVSEEEWLKSFLGKNIIR